MNGIFFLNQLSCTSTYLLNQICVGQILLCVANWRASHSSLFVGNKLSTSVMAIVTPDVHFPLFEHLLTLTIDDCEMQT